MKEPCDWEKPIHMVTTDNYYIGETQVTQSLWQEVMGNNPSFFKGDNQPVDNVSWMDCQKFIKKLNQKTGKKFRLPTEAEWEFAGRGGNKSNHYQYSGSNYLDEVAWDYGNSGNRSHSVKTKKQNELGIYDMSGNVLEWCHDWYGCYTNNEQINPTGPFDGEHRVCRGGHWHDSTWYCRLSTRSRHKPDTSGGDIGFRLALSE